MGSCYWSLRSLCSALSTVNCHFFYFVWSDAKWAISELFYGENKLRFDEDIGGDDNDVHFILYNTLSRIFIVLVHWSNSSQVA
jgi:hypothetical protein